MLRQAGPRTQAGLKLISTGACLAALAAASMLLVPMPAHSQAPTPTAQQLQLLNSLPPAQREQLLRQMQQAQGQAAAQPPEFPQVVQPAAADELELRELEALLDLPPRLEIGSTLVVGFTLREDSSQGLSADGQTQRAAFRDRLAAGNPYQLDVTGTLSLPGVRPIALAGLTVEEATVRISAETSLRDIGIAMTLLPLEPVGVAALEPFGYDLFKGVPTTFAPATDVPVPAEYVMGPGDTVNVQLFGNQNAEYVLAVSREGAINFPEIGPINVGGLTFVEMREIIAQRVVEQMIGVRASITLGELRSIRIFMLGDVERPGSYTVSGLSTMTNALFVSGGVREIGSLRNIALRRDGETVSTLDLYDLLLRGDTSDDARLLPGDVIFVPTVGTTVAVDGAVRRPAVYELVDEATVADVIALAGGLRPSASVSTLKLERIVSGRGTAVQDIDASTAPGSGVSVQDGDVLRVLSNLEQMQSTVRLEGNVYRPGPYQWRAGMRLSDLLPGPDFLKPLSDLGYVLIRREIEPNVFVEALSADLRAAWRDPGGLENIALQPRDTVYVFNLEIGRDYIVAPLLDELGAQAPANDPVALAHVGGQVRAPGDYPLEPGMRISDLIRAGGGFTESAYVLDAELTRYEVVNGEYREIELVTVDLPAIMRGDATADLLITAHDYLNVREVPLWREQRTVELVGEIVFPGVYPIRSGEYLSSVLERAGGLTDAASASGSVFLRDELRQKEREQLETLAARVEADLTNLSLSDPEATEALGIGQSLITQLRSTEPAGRLVIRLDGLVAGDPSGDIILKAGDRLLVPEASQTVTVLGEVQYATSHIYEPGLSRDDYIQSSGGLNRRADAKQIYVVHANGSVSASGGSRWFNRQRGEEILPGDTVVVPIDTGRVRPLTLWTGVTQVIYNLAIAVTAINSF